MQKDKNLFYWISAWSPVVLGAIVIFCESSELFGADHTSGPIRHFVEYFFGHMSNSRWEFVHHYIRKAGHFIGYGLIGLFWLRAWWMTLRHSRFFIDALLALAGTAFIASCDEFHQSFLTNRTGTPFDVLIDCSGALVLQMVVYGMLRCFRPKKLARVLD